ncbi:helix-turn-helix domain-containing protein [Micrococcus luteus]|nr:helix-turn-helix domain-containing protein [Micrococcus luteus]MCV7459232.1 helix-turn-helix domain-containing protein [Micrococcus luteus]MCV7523504.1 helix-turn-helix domain-containing protein [Micrococcus luteus]MCV7643206.1 helix-turn-helix domain-containing protein [Micrococcus luteus]MCV7670442.1 helix-turn-helix domain-containing protein [Micrococcus luteus]
MTNTQGEWSAELSARIGRNVRRVRLRAGMGVQQVADICTNELGFAMLRPTLANLEAGKRKNVTAAEVIVLAEALKTSPLRLVFPVDDASPIEYLPGQQVSAWEAWTRFTHPLVESLGAVDEHFKPGMDRHESAVISNYAFLQHNQAAWLYMRDQLHDQRLRPAARQALEREMNEVAVEGMHALNDLDEAQLSVAGFDSEWIAAIRAVQEWCTSNPGDDDAAPSA